MKHVTYLDGWRGIAIIFVLLNHFIGLNFFGRTGVDLFFALSGLLMSRILFIEKMPLSVFYNHRIARILPVLYLYLFVMGIIGWIYIRDFDIDDVIYSLLFLRTYIGGEIRAASIPIGHLWSLNIEEHSYLFLSIISFICIGYPRCSPRPALGISAFICAFFYGIYKLYPPAAGHSQIFERSECGAFGLFVSGYMFLWQHKYRLKVAQYFPIVALAIGCAFGFAYPHGPLKFIISPIFLALSLNTLDQAPPWFLKLLNLAALRKIGVYSFSIYIWQQPFYEMRLRHLWNMPMLTGLLLAIATGVASYYFYEQPMRKWIRNMRFLNPPSPASSSPK